MPENKKPDQVVFNAVSKSYDAALKPYATNVGAPAIKALMLRLGKTRTSIRPINKSKQNI